MLAAKKGKLETSRDLKEMGADINILDEDNDTAIHFAARLVVWIL